MAEIISKVCIEAMVPANGVGTLYAWWNMGPGSQDLRLVGIDTWMGAQERAVIDFAAHVRRASDQMPIQINGWDHYAEPVDRGNRLYWFAPHYYTIKKLDGLHMTIIGGYPTLNPMKNIGVIVTGYFISDCD